MAAQQPIAQQPRTDPRRRVVALLNATAGTVGQVPDEMVRTVLEAVFAKHGVAAEFQFLPGGQLHEATEAALKRARRSEIDAVAVGGGDGSVSCVAGVLAGTGVPLGVLPLGTLNHFARDAGIPLELEAAARTIARGTIRAVDLAEVNGEIFVNNSSIGIYPYLVIARDKLRRRHKLAKWIAVVPAFFRMLRHFPRRHLKIWIEGRATPYRTPCVLVGNNEYAMELLALTRRKRLDAGAIWLYVLKPRSPLPFFWTACRLILGKADHVRDVDIFAARKVEITARASRLPVALDGEVKTLKTPLRYRSRPGALQVIVPVSRLAGC
jgi:diacylglycerol kinase family enzyme